MAVVTSLSKSPQGSTCLRLNLSFLWAYSGANLAFKVPQGRTCLRLNLSCLLAYSGSNLAFKVPHGRTDDLRFFGLIAVLTSLSKSPQGRTCLRLNLRSLWHQRFQESMASQFFFTSLNYAQPPPYDGKILFNLHYLYVIAIICTCIVHTVPIYQVT
jgi:hypothetical protein